ncbi:hypothetical protein MMC19_003601 [Ptychographa xylographoides]|nr:hypothetical protein [Ptychographa xylographoides]
MALQNHPPSPIGSGSGSGSLDHHLAAHDPSPLRSAPVESVYSHSSYSDSVDSTAASSVDDVQPQQQPHRPLRPGVYVPTLCFFSAGTEELDRATIATHAVRLARAGVAGLATQGSNGEAVHLTPRERQTVTSVTRQALNDAGFGRMPIIVGCGAQSTRETIALCHDAAVAGGDYALVLPPAYYKPFLPPAALHQFFLDVAAASPLPLLIYNYPAAVAGTDLDSDAIIALAAHPNIVGCKLTCGNTGKLARIAAATHAVTPAPTSSSFCPTSPVSTSTSTSDSTSTSASTSNPDPDSDSEPGFMVLAGSADFTLPMLVARGSGVICGLANVAPRACVEILALHAAGHHAKAADLQALVARADWAAIQGGIVGTKSALCSFWGYGGVGRRPLLEPTGEERERWRVAFEEVVGVERAFGG